MKKLTLFLIILACLTLMVPALAQQMSRERQRYETIPPQKSFTPLEIYLDSGAAHLAAYQFELTATAGAVTIAGVENGDHNAFSTPPPTTIPPPSKKTASSSPPSTPAMTFPPAKPASPPST